MPISILEALASGVPVVSTNVGGVPFLVENEKTALLVPPSDPQSMAQALMRVLTMPELSRHMSEAGLVTVQQYTWQCVRARLFSVYDRLCHIELAHFVAENK
jgi:glycosyltransferase involved in cell wall biosynthesis